MSVIGREGLGFKYEDCVRTSALIHMYAKCKFLNIDENITSITLGVAKLGVTTDDILIETDSNMIFMQAKSEITGFADKQFIEAVFNAYTDYFNDLNTIKTLNSTSKDVFYYIICKRISTKFFNSSRIALNNVHGCTYEQYLKIKKEKQEIIFIENLKKIINCKEDKDLYNFMKKLMIIEKSTDLEYRLETDIPILTYIFPNNKDPIKCFKLLYAEIGTLKQKNTEITFVVASQVFGRINLNKKNYAVDLFFNKINFFIDFVNHMEIDFQNFHLLTSKVIDLKYEIEMIDETYLNSMNFLTKQIFEKFVKIIIAVDKDIKILNDLINVKNINKIEKINLNIQLVIESKIEFRLLDCLQSLLSSDISYTNHIYSDLSTPIKDYKKNTSILLAGDLSFYKNSKYIDVIKSSISLLKEFNKIDGFFCSLTNIYSFKSENLKELNSHKKILNYYKSIFDFVSEFNEENVKSFIHRLARNHYIELIILESMNKSNEDLFLKESIETLSEIRKCYKLFTNVISDLVDYNNKEKGKKYRLEYLDYLVKFTRIEKHNDNYELINYFFHFIYYVSHKYSRGSDINKNSVHSFLSKNKNFNKETSKKVLLYFLFNYIKHGQT